MAWDLWDPYGNLTAYANWALPVPTSPLFGECVTARYEKAVSGDYLWGWVTTDCAEPHVFICKQMGELPAALRVGPRCQSGRLGAP